MKPLLIISFYLLTINAFAQDCSNYLFLQKNKTVEMTIYNKKGDPGGKQVYNVSQVSNEGGDVTALVTSEMLDKDGKSIAKAVNNIKCTGGVMMMDMKMMMPQQQATQYSTTEATGNNIYLEYPNKITVGDALKDGSFSMDLNNGGLKQSISMTITNRKVEGQESVTTTAGTWNCYKITYHNKFLIKTVGIGIPMNIDGTEWYAPGVGVIKTQSKYGGTAITSIK